jgi:3-hydroxyisobutyrate dehydrogenase-like beta-hydroxyacid dehydrogenase
VTRFAVFGLGEAGAAIAAGLTAGGAEVIAYDPAPVVEPRGVERAADACLAVRGARAVLAITAAADARGALDQALGAIPAGTLYADLSTASPGRKRELADVAAAAHLRFADIALMGTVPDKGVRTPALAAGSGAADFAALMVPLGMPVEVVGPDAGAAATRKLLRSVVLKGFASLLVECLRAATEAGLAEETWDNLVDQFAEADAAFLHRLVDGTRAHAVRRLHEMEAVEALLGELGVDAAMTRATVDVLRRVPTDGIPDIPRIPGRGAAT